jgi:hypothetical protein
MLCSGTIHFNTFCKLNILKSGVILDGTNDTWTVSQRENGFHVVALKEFSDVQRCFFISPVVVDNHDDGRIMMLIFTVISCWIVMTVMSTLDLDAGSPLGKFSL